MVKRCLNAWDRTLSTVSHTTHLQYCTALTIVSALDVNMLRKTMKSAYNTAISATNNTQRPNGIQVLPVLWRHEISFGMASDDDDKELEMDLGTVGADDGSPTLDELTLEGVPNIRLVVSDVLLDGMQLNIILLIYVCSKR